MDVLIIALAIIGNAITICLCLEEGIEKICSTIKEKSCK